MGLMVIGGTEIAVFFVLGLAKKCQKDRAALRRTYYQISPSLDMKRWLSFWKSGQLIRETKLRFWLASYQESVSRNQAAQRQEKRISRPHAKEESIARSKGENTSLYRSGTGITLCDCLDAGHDANTVIDSLYQENHDMFRHSGFPPRPLGATLPDNLRCRRFVPSKQVIKILLHSHKQKTFYDLVNFTSAEKLLQDKLQKDQFDLRKPECTCPRPAKGSGKRWLCSNDRENGGKEACKAFGLDATGAVDQYGCRLFTFLLVNPLTMRGIPIAHMHCGRISSSDIKEFALFIKKLVSTWGMEWLVVDKDLPEAQGIIDFDKDVHIFVCYFHVKEAIHRWLVTSKNQVPAHLREIVKQAVSQLHFIAEQDKYCAARDRILGEAMAKAWHRLLKYKANPDELLPSS
eukprot:g42899.t1